MYPPDEYFSEKEKCYLGIGSYFTQEKVAEIHKTVGTILDIAYTSGGAVLVEQKIDQLVADGRITAQQGEMLKEAARRSYEALQEKLTELSVKDVTVEAKNFIII